MAGASLRNAVKRKTHKERSQPAHRARLGLLEKHKDYVKRAQDYNKKKKRIRALQEAASFRNPDEYYFKMNSLETKEGVHTKGQNDRGSIPEDMLRVMKTQDLAYINHRKAIDVHKAEKLKNQLHFIGASSQNKHKVFVDNRKEVQRFDAAEHFDTAPELVDRSYNRVRKEKLQNELLMGEVLTKDGSITEDNRNMKQYRKMMKQRDAQYEELGQRIQRASKLDQMREHLEVERKLAGKGRRKKIKDAEGGKPAVYKWKRQRTK